MSVQPESPKLKVNLSWKAYYKVFSEKHGGVPILYKGRQYFRDGWSYSATDYAGPEWPPPSDPKELLTLQRVYWYTLHNRCRNELLILRRQFDHLKGLQEEKDVPLQMIVEERQEGEQGKPAKTIRHAVNWSPKLFEHLIIILEREVEESDTKLKELAAKAKEIADGHAVAPGNSG